MSAVVHASTPKALVNADSAKEFIKPCEEAAVDARHEHSSTLRKPMVSQKELSDV